MAAPYKNKNAEKYNIRKAVSLFNEAIELTNKSEIKTDKEGNQNKSYLYDFIGEIAGELNTFHHIFIHLVERFPILKKKHKQLISNLERNCYYNTKKGMIKEATGIVNLKSNHNWTDRNDHTTQGDKLIITPIQFID